MSLGKKRYKTRYQYKIQTGFKTVDRGDGQTERVPVYKTKTPTRNVEIDQSIEGEDKISKALVEVLTDSHRRENAVDLKVLAYSEATDPTQPQPQAVADEGTKAKVADLEKQVADLQRQVQDFVADEGTKAKVADLEKQVADLQRQVQDLTAALEALTKPDDNKKSGGGK